MLQLNAGEIIILLVFVAWCVAVFFFLRWMSARGKKSAAEPDPARRGIDDLIEKVEKSYPHRDSERRGRFDGRR